METQEHNQNNEEQHAQRHSPSAGRLATGPYSRGSPERAGEGLIPLTDHRQDKIVAWSEEGNKETIWDRDEYKVALPGQGGEPRWGEQNAVTPPTSKGPRKRTCGLRRSVFFLTLAASILVALAVGLGTGLGVGISYHKKSSISSPSNSTSTSSNTSSPTTYAEYGIGGDLDAKYYSTFGAWNGSSITSQNVNYTQGYEEMTVFYQHYSGEIRYVRFESGWTGGTSSESIINDARNSTPLAVAQLEISELQRVHLYYIDQNNQVREKVKSNDTGTWMDGPLNQLKLTALDAEQISFQACFCHVLGDTEFSNTNRSSNRGLRLFYASSNDTIHQLGYSWSDDLSSNDSWVSQKNWTDVNVHAGVGCLFPYPQDPDNTWLYLTFVTTDSNISFYWRNYDTSQTSSDYVVNEWQQSDAKIQGAGPSTDLSLTTFNNRATNYLCFQDIDGIIIAPTVDFDNTAITPHDTPMTLNEFPGLPGSRMAWKNLANINSFMLFYQRNGTDITSLSYNATVGSWTDYPLPVYSD